jgi:ribosomal protein S18 acetylase RimI-like enzyme
VVTEPTIRTATEGEVAEVGALIGVSFDHLVQCHSLVPRPADRLRVMTDFFTFATELAFQAGRIDVIDNGRGIEAAAVWFDRTKEMPEPPDYERRLAAFAGPYLRNFQALDEVFEKNHPTEPHWHLQFLGVHPDRQGHGLGSALMRRMERELDPAGIPQYLEATNENNIRLYHRHGYTDMNPFELYLPDGTPFFRMWRPAGG